MRIAGNEPGMSFYVRGSADEDSLFVQPAVGESAVVLRIPVQALPWRDARIVERHGPLAAFGCGMGESPLAGLRTRLAGPQVSDRTGISGAAWLRLDDGIATVQLEGPAPLVIPCLRIAQGARVPAVVQLTGEQAPQARGEVHVFQLSGGRRAGGVTLQLGGWHPGGDDRSEAGDEPWRRKLDPGLAAAVARASGAETDLVLLLQVIVQGRAEQLEPFGLRLGNRTGDVVLGHAAIRAIPAIARQSCVVFIELSRRLRYDRAGSRMS
jgi:hypothetical protein